MFVPEYRFTLTEHDQERPWIVVSTEHRTIELPDGSDFLYLVSRPLATIALDRAARPVATRAEVATQRRPFEELIGALRTRTGRSGPQSGHSVQTG
jgi:uncharacterized protein involved in type VI secretion and phage assembly